MAGMSTAMRRKLAGTTGALCLVAACAAQDFEAQRMRLVEEIERSVSAAQPFTGRSELDPRVLEAIARVPRHAFVPAGLAARAYENRALPIGEGQTISQPYIVALMTDLAALDADATVLEIGTGSGYQAAVLAEIAREVYTIEIIEPLGRRAAATLAELGYDNVSVRIGDGYRGWPEHAPFDAILVTAAPEEVPAPLIEQLAPGGRLVIPVGGQQEAQTLRVLEKGITGQITETDVLPVLFVPFLRDDE
jgi:protein-L-isoaspartate(D-aspartate) O-methyltransferase